MLKTAPNRHVNKGVAIGWIIFYIIIFFVALDLMGASLKILGTDTVQSFFQGANNPFIGLFIGLLATAIIQSSSTTTSVTIALVASGAFKYDTAIPIIMGANIGTSLTATLVSLAFIGHQKKFPRALSAALSHNFFNVILVVILFPLEYYYGILSDLALGMTALVSDSLIVTNQAENNVLNGFSISKYLFQWIDNGFIVLIISFSMLFLSIKLLAKSIYDVLVANHNSDFTSLFNNPYKSFSFGLILTAGVQSSSVTTSFAVPVAATGEISVKNIFPFILGANIGTTITAFFASLLNSEAALVIAFAHLLFNVFGVVAFLPFPALRDAPVRLAVWFGELTLQYRIIGFLYLLFIFFILPFTLIYLNGGI